MTEHDARAAQLEEQVRLLAAGLGIPVEDPTQVVTQEVLALARVGRQVEAVRVLRRMGFGLVTGKRIVDAALERDAPAV